MSPTNLEPIVIIAQEMLMGDAPEPRVFRIQGRGPIELGNFPNFLRATILRADEPFYWWNTDVSEWASATIWDGCGKHDVKVLLVRRKLGGRLGDWKSWVIAAEDHEQWLLTEDQLLEVEDLLD